MFDAPVKSTLAEIGELWDATERIVKQAERIRAEVVEPSINELRYAGRQLVDAINLADAAKQDEKAKQRLDGHIHDCRLRCYCAQHDAFDASILFVQRVIKTYEDEFGIALMHKHFPWLIDFKVTVLEADELIVDSRKTRGERVDVYLRLSQEFLPKIVQEYKRLVTSRDALIALFEDQSKDARKDGFQFWTVIWVTVAAAVGGGALGAVITILMTIYFHSKNMM